MMKFSSVVIACLALCMAFVAVSAEVNVDNVAESPMFSSALAEINAQISEHMRMTDSLGEGEGMADKTLPVPPVPTGSAYQPSDERFRATSQEVVAALNSLDMKASHGEGAKAPTPAENPRAAVAAFASIALETIHRGHSALGFLKSHHVAIQKQVNVDLLNYKSWVRTQEDAARTRIKHEVDRVALLTDEVAHLEHVYQDAIAKERSYQVQSNQLITERQLQRTPPMMPVVSSSALTDKQYEEALKKLADYREKALQVIKQTSAGIRHRRMLISQGSEWITHSEAVLKQWMEKQNGIIAQHDANGKKAIADSEKRILAVEKIITQANKFHKDYLHALEKLDLQARVKHLQDVKSKPEYDPKKAEDEYAATRLKSWIKGIDAEIAGVEKKIKTIPGTTKTVPPPAFWGVLSQFPHVAAPIPHIAAPVGGVYGQGYYYHAAYHNNAAPIAVPHPSVASYVPTTPEDVSPIDDVAALYSTRYDAHPQGHFSPLAYANGGNGDAVGEGEVKQIEQDAKGAAEGGESSKAESSFIEEDKAAQEMRFRSNDVVRDSARVVEHHKKVPNPPDMPDLPGPPRADEINM